MRNSEIKIVFIAGARPNFIKIAPLIREARKYQNIKSILIHTGQHYDWEMSRVFFEELNISEPEYNLNIGSGPHGWQTAKIIEKLEPILLKEKPDLVVVVGDVNSTLAGALVAAKLSIPAAHIEAGLRSFNKEMPEEINRLLTDHISKYLFATEPQAVKNLIEEGISKKSIFYVGNVMIDSLLRLKIKSKNLKFYEKFNIKPKEYAVLTLHRPENVDNKKTFKEILEAIGKIQNKIKIIWPIHPRTRKQLEKFDFYRKIKKMNNLFLVKPLGYLEMLSLNIWAKFILTDSGGIQEETTATKIPCLTLRKNTERPITVVNGTNIVVGTNKEKIIAEAFKILNGNVKKGRIPKYWDGKASQRIIKRLNRLM